MNFTILKSIIFLILLQNTSTYSYSVVAEVACKDSTDVTVQLIYSDFINMLSNFSDLNIIERKNINSVLKEQSVQSTGITDDKMIVKTGQLLNADFIFQLNVFKNLNNYLLEIKLINVIDAKLLSFYTDSLNLNEHHFNFNQYYNMLIKSCVFCDTTIAIANKYFEYIDSNRIQQSYALITPIEKTTMTFGDYSVNIQPPKMISQKYVNNLTYTKTKLPLSVTKILRILSIVNDINKIT